MATILRLLSDVERAAKWATAAEQFARQVPDLQDSIIRRQQELITPLVLADRFPISGLLAFEQLRTAFVTIDAARPHLELQLQHTAEMMAHSFAAIDLAHHTAAAGIQQVAESIRASFAMLDLPAELVTEISESFPEAPAPTTADSLREWRLSVWRWFADTLNAMNRPDVRASIAGGAAASLLIMLISALVSHVAGSGSTERSEAGRRVSQTAVSSSVVGPQLVVANRMAIVRLSPNTTSRAVQRLAPGSAVVAVKCSGHWCLCEYRDARGIYQQGWIYRPRLISFRASH